MWPYLFQKVKSHHFTSSVLILAEVHNWNVLKNYFKLIKANIASATTYDS